VQIGYSQSVNKQQLLKKRKYGYLLYCASTEETLAGILANSFCKWLPAEAGLCWVPAGP
jgi:hypothetical protein